METGPLRSPVGSNFICISIAARTRSEVEDAIADPPGSNLRVFPSRSGRMRVLVASLCAAVAAAAPTITVNARPATVYSSVSSKMRIQGTGFGTAGGENIKLKFIPAMDEDDYKVTVVSDSVLSLGLKPGKFWPSSTEEMSGDGTTMYMTSFVNPMKGAGNLLDEPVAVANARIFRVLLPEARREALIFLLHARR